MTTARHVVSLLKSYIARDEDRFLATAMQLAAHEARQGHAKLAQELKELIDAAKAKKPAMQREDRPVPLVQPKGELAGLLSAHYPDLRLPDMILPEAIAADCSGAERTAATTELVRSRTPLELRLPKKSMIADGGDEE
jgi:hypothetical protein